MSGILIADEDELMIVRRVSGINFAIKVSVTAGDKVAAIGVLLRTGGILVQEERSILAGLKSSNMGVNIVLPIFHLFHSQAVGQLALDGVALDGEGGVAKAHALQVMASLGIGSLDHHIVDSTILLHSANEHFRDTILIST